MNKAGPAATQPAADTPSPETVYRQRDNVVTREIAGETLLVPISGNLADMQRIFSLNAVGAWIWRRLDGSPSFADLLGELLVEYDVPPEQASRDLSELLHALLAQELVEKVAIP